MEKRKFTDLTKAEVHTIVSDIFEPKKITNIKVHKRDDSITCNIYTKWYSKDEEGKEVDLLICDEIELKIPFDYGKDAIQADFKINKEDYARLKSFCYAKGIYGHEIKWLTENPYL